MRLINADALLEKITQYAEYSHGVILGNMFLREVVDEIEEAPTVDALPLRCRIGDEVWVVGTKCMSGLNDDECPDESEWNSFDDFCEDCPLDREYIVFPRKVNSYNFAYFHELDPEDHNPLLIWGETVFKTKEEAEAALAKMEK